MLKLGPSISHTEPNVDAAPVADLGYRTVSFGDPATEAGGRVNVVFDPPASATDVAPVRIHAVFVQPADQVPPLEERTPELFLNSGQPMAAVDVDPAATGAAIVVPGVQPGVHFVQVILEFVDPS